MRPVSRSDADIRDPVDRAAARRPAKDETAEFSFWIGVRVQRFEAQHLRLERDRM
jgi:hypothetical protein